MSGKKCHVAVPRGAPPVKVRAIEGYGGIAHFCEPNDEGREACRGRLVHEFQAEMIHPSQVQKLKDLKDLQVFFLGPSSYRWARNHWT